jgi:hypothetical protein
MVRWRPTASLEGTRFCLLCAPANAKQFVFSAVLVNGQVPGPLIVGNKVVQYYSLRGVRIPINPFQGDEFNLNVIDKLTESSMSTSTSIARQSSLFKLPHCSPSISSTGMDSFKREAAGQTGIHPLCHLFPVRTLSSAASVTQCPISPGNSFLYTFSSAEQGATNLPASYSYLTTTL